MNPVPLTQKQTRALVLACIGLLRQPLKPATKADLLPAIRQIHGLQIDTISVVARAHLHILWSRLGNYDPAWLDELHAEGRLFEQFLHGASFLPMEDFSLYYPIIQYRHQHYKPWLRWAEGNQEAIAQMRQYLQQNGEVRSADFKAAEKRGPWWDWKAEKNALEYLLHAGEVMIPRRQRFQRVYALREQVLPDWSESQALPFEDALAELVRRAAIALGAATAEWMANYFYLPKQPTLKIVKAMEARGDLLPVKMEGLENTPLFVHKENEHLLEQTLYSRLQPNYTTILSPFDPLVTDRGRARTLFNFDYLIECYTPAAKRKYGYFTLPLLHQGELVGRMDAKAWRKEGRLQVIHLHVEEGLQPQKEMAASLASAIQGYAAWQGLETITLDAASPAIFHEPLSSELV